jgi:hypothetical protein
MINITQSDIDRQNILNNPFALNKIQSMVKNFSYFEMEDKIFILKKDVAEFYQVSEDSIERVLNENDQELRKNGYEVLTGKRLAQAKSVYVNRKLAVDLGDSKFAGSWGVFDFRAFLNVGMLLKNSLIAQELRSKILNIVIEVAENKIDKHLLKECVLNIMNETDEDEQWLFKLCKALNK